MTSLRMAPADPARDLAAIAHFTAGIFGQPQGADQFAEGYFGHSHYDWDTTRLIWDGEQLVHHWGVWGYAMRLETARLNVAGIGAVATAETHRLQGLMRQAATASFAAMHANGYDLTILRGRYYARFGYRRAWNYVTYRLQPDEIPALSLKAPYVPLGAAHTDGIVALYNRDYEAYSGTAVRPTYRLLHGEDMGAYGWFDGEGRLEGYVRALPSDDKQALRCLEAAGDTEQGLAVLADLFKRGEYKALEFFTLPDEHPMPRLLRRGACVVENRYFHRGGWQVRLVNLRSTLEKIRPLLAARLQRSGLACWQGDLYLDAGEQGATLRIRAGEVEVAPAAPGEHRLSGGPDLARLLIGSDEPREVIRQAAMTCAGDAAELADVLFPNLHPMLSHWDEY